MIYFLTLFNTTDKSRTSERVSSRPYVRFPVEVEKQQTFSILKPTMNPLPLGAQDATYKDANATVLSTCAAAFLFLDESAVFFLCTRGSRDIPSALHRVSGGDEGAFNALAVDASKRGFGGTSTNVLSATCPCQCVFDLAACAALGRH